jgi:beta-aspartyl-peptidase (threonine type)
VTVVLLLLVVGFALTAFLASSRSSAEEPKEPASAVRKVLEDQVAAWNHGDLEGFMTGYWHSPELTFFSGKDKRHGWQETIDRYRKRYQSEGRQMGKLNFSELQVELLSSESAWVRGRWHVVTGNEELGGLFTLIFKKFPEGWRIVHDHTSG